MVYETTDFFSPALYRRLILPDLKLDVERAHACGAKLAVLSTSSFTPLLDCYVEAGVDVLGAVLNRVRLSDLGYYYSYYYYGYYYDEADMAGEVMPPAEATRFSGWPIPPARFFRAGGIAARGGAGSLLLPVVLAPVLMSCWNSLLRSDARRDQIGPVEEDEKNKDESHPRLFPSRHPLLYLHPHPQLRQCQHLP